MPVCPVCEHPQERGDSCDLCGKHLTGPGVVVEPTPPIDGLEPTRLEAAPGSDPAPLPDLEPTLLAAATVAMGDEAAGWIERTAAEPVPAMRIEAVADVERAPEPVRSPPPDWFAAPTCRYCRRQGAPGDVSCTACGMKLATYQPSAPEPARREPRRCSRCGTIAADERCPGCGARLATEEA